MGPTHCEWKNACIGHTVYGYYSSYSLVTHQRNFKNGENCSLTCIKEKKGGTAGGGEKEKVLCPAISSNEQNNHVSKKNVKKENKRQPL